VHVVGQIHRTAVIVVDAARRPRAPIGVAGAAAVAVPGDVDDQVILAVVLEFLIEGEAEPVAGASAEVVGALLKYLERRVAVEVGGEVGYELGGLGVTQLNGEVVVRPRVAGITTPLPFLNGAAGNRVRTQNQVLAPCRVDASTAPPRVVRHTAFAADDEVVRERRAHRHSAQATDD